MQYITLQRTVDKRTLRAEGTMPHTDLSHYSNMRKRFLSSQILI